MFLKIKGGSHFASNIHNSLEQFVTTKIFQLMTKSGKNQSYLTIVTAKNWVDKRTFLVPFVLSP